jgi:phosphatidylglycerophosphate synthase
MRKTREFFSETSSQLMHYDIYQPIVIKIAPWFVKNNITPNQISMLRLFTVLGIAGFMTLNAKKGFLQGNNKKIAALIISFLYILCGISDDLDGYMARKYNMKSKSGAVLDVIADLTTAISVIYIISLYTKRMGVIISIVMGIYLYQQIEHNRIKKDLDVSPVMSIMTHTWFLYAVVISFLLINCDPL